MTTLNDIVEEIRSDYLLTGDVEVRNRLGAVVDDTVTTLNLARSNAGFTEGTRVEVGYEDVYVVTGTQASSDLTVERGQFGSVAQAHLDGELMLASPKYSKASIARALNRELQALSGNNRLYQMKSLSITFNSSQAGYDFTDKDAATPTDPNDVYSIWEIRAKMPNPLHDWPLLEHYKLSRNMPAADFPSTLGIFFDIGGYPGFDMVCRYRAPFTPIDFTDPLFDPAVTDISTVTGLPIGAEDLLTLGVAIKLTAGKEVKRNFTASQGTTRRPDEVPPSAVLQSYTGLLKQYDRRLEQEKARLATLYPVRTKTTGIVG